jgi:hypothetical protein
LLTKQINLRSILRFSMPASVLFYCAALHFAYVHWISLNWAYLGLTYKSPDASLLALAYTLAAMQCAVSPLRLSRPSHAIYWVLYFIVYIPGLFVPLFLQLSDGFALFLLQLSLTGGMLAVTLSYKFPLIAVRRYHLSPSLFWVLFTALFIAANAALVVANRDSLHFASIKEIAMYRYQTARVHEENPGITYVSQLVANVLDPLLISYGLAKRSYILALLGILGEVLVYATAVTKASFLASIVIFGFYYSIRRDRGGWVPKVGLLLAGMLFSLTTLVIGAKPGLLFNVATVTLVRTFAYPGLLTAEYQYFFENRPHTYLSTVRGVNFFVPNPYTLPLGQEMGAFYGRKAGREHGIENENANFFATDGIGGFGLWGIPIVGALCAAVFWILDSFAKDYSMEFAVSALAMVIMSLGNVSIFTTLLGNGLIVWILLFFVMPRTFLHPGVPKYNPQNRPLKL